MWVGSAGWRPLLGGWGLREACCCAVPRGPPPGPAERFPAPRPQERPAGTSRERKGRAAGPQPGAGSLADTRPHSPGPAPALSSPLSAWSWSLSRGSGARLPGFASDFLGQGATAGGGGAEQRDAASPTRRQTWPFLSPFKGRASGCAPDKGGAPEMKLGKGLGMLCSSCPHQGLPSTGF